ncbi:excisionase family DNA binding protein [Arthrobacter silviterrae]|uniref:Helix-turn-helix domain-containing protein n=1 Tax=Arthrobacter silviterrae TaxID=2026658 RepID=A0ABX0DDR9_9MICC|nr:MULTISPECIES: helix-turn-helix domain-containing protein [Arthrobacter]MCU6478896.1 helix-turn-helix domain-containing protein [Arthrobacter sp. A2-55]MDQ0277867.1 excisionase family DNA binding protein [Arthrobacter silviterrae]NGN85077.1 helix-turn-helix domain-containing protein [Arthrobacter silviterrae]
MAQGQNFSNVNFLTVQEVAELMRVSKMTVYRMVHAGELPAVRFGRSYRVPQNAVEAILKSTVADRAESEGNPGSAHTG